MRGVLFDLPYVAERAKTRIEAALLASCCDVVGGDFCEVIPGEADAYFFRLIIHDWDSQMQQALVRPPPLFPCFSTEACETSLSYRCAKLIKFDVDPNGKPAVSW